MKLGLTVNDLENDDFGFIDSKDIVKTDEESGYEAFAISLGAPLYTFARKVVGKPVPVRRHNGALIAKTFDMPNPMKMAYIGEFNPTQHIEIEVL